MKLSPLHNPSSFILFALLALFFWFFNIFPKKFPIALTLNILSFLSPLLPPVPSSLSLFYLCYLLFGSFSNVQRYSISVICLLLNENLPENMTREEKCELYRSPQRVLLFPQSRVQQLVGLHHRPSMVVLSTAHDWFRLQIFLFSIPALPPQTKASTFLLYSFFCIQITECENRQMAP